MADIHWIKLSTSVFDDEKIRLIEAMDIGDSYLIVWIKLLCLAGRQNNKGNIQLTEDKPFTLQQLKTLLHKPMTIIETAMHTFKELGMISFNGDPGIITITNWESHQNIDAMERLKKSNRERQQRYREAQSKESNVTSRYSNGTEKRRVDKNKNIYGEFKNVLLTVDEKIKLVKRFGADKTARLIETLSTGIESKGYKYKSHYAAILAWERKEPKVESGKKCRVVN